LLSRRGRAAAGDSGEESGARGRESVALRWASGRGAVPDPGGGRAAGRRDVARVRCGRAERGAARGAARVRAGRGGGRRRPRVDRRRRMTARGPGPVAAAHRLLIVAGLLCALLYAGWEALRFTDTRETLGVVRAATAFLVAIAIGVYLRSLRGLGAKLT